MTSTQINIAIAQLRGWKEVFVQDGVVKGLKEGGSHYQVVPDYANSLDACALFENKLTKREADDYIIQLWKLSSDSKIEQTLWNQDTFAKTIWRWLCFATPPQRSEAFLRLHGKWVE